VSRSYLAIMDADLYLLAELAARDRRDLFARRPDMARLYVGHVRDRL
jgi:hypothetical protein